jgi:hypothetical protein
VSEPTDDAVRAAIAAYDDPEITRLTADPGSFVLRPVSVQGDRFALYHVILLEVPHPMSVLLAVDGDDAVITSGRPRVVAEIVERDPSLGEAATVWDLIRGGPVDGHLQDASSADAVYEFAVRDDKTDELRRWRLELAPPALQRVS